jgi:hypothetical protein
MKASFLSVLTLILCANLNSGAFTNPIDTVSKYPVKVIYLDSMFWEIERGRSCEVLVKAQAKEALKLQTELLTQGKIINLKKSEVTHLEEIITAIQKDYSAIKAIKDEKINSLKVRIRKLTVMIIGETGLVILLVVLLL